jgi:long-chain acyl-CoA synthetase
MTVTTAASLCAQFQETAARHAGEVALRTADGAVELTWAQYRDRVEHAARGLHALGVRRGDTVAMRLPNHPDFHVADVAALHLGATPFSL